MNKITFAAPAVVQKALDRKNVKQTVVRFESPAEMAAYALKVGDASGGAFTRSGSWSGNETLEQTCRKVSVGDETYCAGYEKLMQKFEEFDVSTFRPQWRDDVTGSRPNIQAFIAGQPLSMRRRVKDDSSTGPMAIIVDTTLSTACNRGDMEKRGSAILALLRILSAKRPVELWVASCMDANGCDWGCVLSRVQTTPLDTATSSFIFGSLSYTRRLCYGIGEKEFNFKGLWGFDDDNVSRKHMKALFAPLFEHVEETLCIPGMNSQDKLVKNPEAWITEQIQRFAPHEAGDQKDF
jgi:hypothetical protein